MHARADAFVTIRERLEQALVARAGWCPEALLQRLARDVALNRMFARERDETDGRAVRRYGGIDRGLARHDSTEVGRVADLFCQKSIAARICLTS
jgi:hypothetical protein